MISVSVTPVYSNKLFEIQWSTDNPRFTGFIIERMLSGDKWTPLAQVDNNVRKFLDNEWTLSNKQFWWRITGVYSGGGVERSDSVGVLNGLSSREFLAFRKILSDELMRMSPRVNGVSARFYRKNKSSGVSDSGLVNMHGGGFSSGRGTHSAITPYREYSDPIHTSLEILSAEGAGSDLNTSGQGLKTFDEINVRIPALPLPNRDDLFYIEPMQRLFIFTRSNTVASFKGVYPLTLTTTLEGLKHSDERYNIL